LSFWPFQIFLLIKILETKFFLTKNLIVSYKEGNQLLKLVLLPAREQF